MYGGGQGAPPGGYGQAPGGYGYPAGAPQGYGPQQPPPQPGWGQPPAPQPKKGSVLPWIALALAALVLVGGGLAAVAYFVLMKKPAPHMARYVPKATTLYAELPSAKRSMLSALQMKPLDATRADEKRTTDDAVVAVANAFSVSEPAARAFIAGVESAAFAARDTNGAGKAAVLVGFSNADACEKLLRSPRFSDKGAAKGGGKRYTLDRKPAGAGKGDAFEEALSEMAVGGSKDWLVWFPKTKLLVFGDEEMVEEIGVVQDGGASLEESEAYVKAKRTFESGSDVAFFYDTHDLDDARDPAEKKLYASYLRGRDPVTGAIKIVRAGVMMDVHATLSGPGLPPDALVPRPAKLVFPQKLPADTVAYTAFSTKTTMTGAAVRSTLIQRIEDQDPAMAKEVRDELDVAEKSMGFKLDDLVDLAGDEGVFAVVLDPTFKLDATNGIADELVNVGVVYGLTVKDDAKAKMVLHKIRTKLEGMTEHVTVRPVGADGFEVDPDTTAEFPLPNVTVKYDGRQILAVLAGGSLSERAFDALLRQKNTLGKDPAHQLALGELPPEANMIMWLDTGRITSLMLDGASRVRRGAAGSTLPIEAIRLTGPDRVTTAVAMRTTVKAGAWTIDLDSLNLPATALFAVAEDLGLGGALSGGGVFRKRGTRL